MSQDYKDTKSHYRRHRDPYDHPKNPHEYHMAEIIKEMFHITGDPKDVVPRTQAYALFNNFCTEEGIPHIGKITFYRLFGLVYPQAQAKRCTNRRSEIYGRHCFTGLKISKKPEVELVTSGKNYTWLGVQISKAIKSSTGMKLEKAHFRHDGFYMRFKESGLRGPERSGGINNTGTDREPVTYEIIIK